MRQRQNSESPRGIELQTFGFRAPRRVLSVYLIPRVPRNALKSAFYYPIFPSVLTRATDFAEREGVLVLNRALRFTYNNLRRKNLGTP